MARFNPHHDASHIYDAAQAWERHCLSEDGSVFSDSQLWTPTLLDELDRRFVQNLDEGDGDFFEKLESQLRAGSPECHQLMAEALWLLMLFQSNIGAAKKAENVRRVWSWSGSELPREHQLLSDAVLEGLGSAGTAYNTQRWRELSLLIAALRTFKQRPSSEQQTLLKDGWSFAEMAEQLSRSA
ncbi:hypothetical protein [Mesorhizobium onobrychidis]|uniref:hypothetical protein n=1 Tax=Mesorhizobium onobrychidis TaxID=2775404 RepID=UPI002157154F|nr:hypothetical protein [Mesorhizobium onobrychidis]